MSKKKKDVNESKGSEDSLKEIIPEPPTLSISSEREIALDFATKVYKEFDQMIKSVVLFGSSAKKISRPESDIDVIVIIDDVALKWDEELVSWYREELGKIVQANPYRKALHINTVKLSTWWQDLMRGDPVVINVLRYGDALIDIGGFFNPLKILLQDGKIRSTPESIYTLLQRSPHHLARARNSLLGAVDGYYWAMVDSAHAALIAAGIMPPSPEHIPDILYEEFVKKGMLKSKYKDDYAEIHSVAKEIVHGKITEVRGRDIESYSDKADGFVREMARIVKELIDKS